MQEQGNASEMDFMAKAVRKGLSVSKPMFVERYDCIIDNGKNFLKIQIKSTNHKPKESYQISLLKGSTKKDKYVKNDCNFFAVHLYKINVWYIIPFGESATHLYLNPHREDCRYDRYKEAWNLLFSNKDELSTNETLKHEQQLEQHP